MPRFLSCALVYLCVVSGPTAPALSAVPVPAPSSVWTRFYDSLPVTVLFRGPAGVTLHSELLASSANNTALPLSLGVLSPSSGIASSSSPESLSLASPSPMLGDATPAGASYSVRVWEPALPPLALAAHSGSFVIQGSSLVLISLFPMRCLLLCVFKDILLLSFFNADTFVSVEVSGPVFNAFTTSVSFSCRANPSIGQAQLILLAPAPHAGVR